LRQNAQRPRVHFHNTFFYNKLFADTNEYNYKAVQRCMPVLRARSFAGAMR
jgi:Ulp1 family protease